MNTDDKNGEKRVNHKENGKFAKGNCANPKGRPRNAEMDMFRKALANVQAEADRRPIYEHFIRTAYDDNTVLISLMRKMLPDLKMVEADIKTEGFRIVIERPQDKPAVPLRAEDIKDILNHP